MVLPMNRGNDQDFKGIPIKTDLSRIIACTFAEKMQTILYTQGEISGSETVTSRNITVITGKKGRKEKFATQATNNKLIMK